MIAAERWSFDRLRRPETVERERLRQAERCQPSSVKLPCAAVSAAALQRAGSSGDVFEIEQAIRIIASASQD